MTLASSQPYIANTRLTNPALSENLRKTIRPLEHIFISNLDQFKISMLFRQW